MDRADFIRLVRLSEHASAENSARYRRGIAAFAALGYAWVAGCLALGVGLIAWTMASIGQGRFGFARGWLLLFAFGLLWATLRALWVRFDAPEGVRLDHADAPLLFETLERIRSKIDGPPIHHVYLDSEFNASIRQLPFFGLLGGTVNTLSIGLPLLMALDRKRLTSVLAHEYGHLRGNHARLSAWVYRTRQSCLKLDASLQRDEGMTAVVSQAFFRWYFPRFAARTFAMARADEYEADKVASQLLGASVTAAALTEMVIKRSWYTDRFWPAHWARASQARLPVGPFAKLRKRLRSAPDASFARAALRTATRRVSDVDDTHPVLRDRLDALGKKAQLPAWSMRSSLELLDDAPKWIEHFDRQWCRDHTSDWEQHHAYLGRIRARVQLLAENAEINSADEMVEWADLERRLDAGAAVRQHYERALQMTPQHVGALRGVAQTLPASDVAARLEVLERLHESGTAGRWWAATAAVALLESPDAGGYDEDALRTWRMRFKQAEAAEERAWAEITGTPFFSQIARHDLSEFELDQLRADLARCLPVSRAWLVRKSLRDFAGRRAYVVFLELPGLANEERWRFCRQLEDSLSLPGIALVLWAGHAPTLAEIEREAFGTVWERQAG